MHIPDGYLSPQTAAVMYAASAPFWYVALGRLKRSLSGRMVPLISLFGAFSFVIMMFNLPLPGGTTTHAMGIGVAAVVLGPWGAMVALSVALLLQALFFGDGGILAFGANSFDMAIVGTLVAYGVYRLIAGRSPLDSRRRVVAGMVGSYVGINAAALLVGIQVGLQPLLFTDATGAPLYAFYPLSVAVPAMLISHLTVGGIAEAVVTGGVIAYIQRVDAGLLRATAPAAGVPKEIRPRSGRRLRPLWAGLLVLALLAPLGLMASGAGWGEWGGEEIPGERARAYLSRLSDADRRALAGELGALAAEMGDPELAAAGRSIDAGDYQAAAPLIQARYPELRASAAEGYPRVMELARNIGEPSGLARWSSWWTAPIPDYAPAFLRSEAAGYIISALAGILLSVGAVRLLGLLLARREPA